MFKLLKYCGDGFFVCFMILCDGFLIFFYCGGGFYTDSISNRGEKAFESRLGRSLQKA